MKIQDIVIATVVMASMLFGALAAYSNLSDAYIKLNPSLVNSTTEKMVGNETTTKVEVKMDALQNRTLKIGTKVSTWDPTAIFDVLGLFVDVGSLLFELPNVIIGLTETVTGKVINLGIPKWFSTLVGVIITIFFAFKILAIFTKRAEV